MGPLRPIRPLTGETGPVGGVPVGELFCQLEVPAGAPVPSDRSRMSADRSRRMAREVLRENCWVRRSQDVDDWRLGCAPTWLSADR